MPPLMPTLAPAPSIIRASAGAARCVAQPSSLLSSPAAVAVAGFSTTASRPKFTKARRLFRHWEKTTSILRKNTTGKAQYLATQSMDLGENQVQPFPLNPHFKSARVLDDKSRELIWEKIVRDGNTIKAVSAEFGVDIRRVAAIVRLKEVEKDWIAKGISLAKPYAQAVQSMLPTYRLRPDMNNAPYEPINELHVHPYTMQQIFWPTSESRHFTREDAAKAFHPKMLSADKRVPHPELIQMERDIKEGVSPYEASERFKQAAMESERKAAEKQIARAELEEKQTTRVNTERFEFRFKQFNANEVGSRGRARNAVGWRYGNPHGDRAKGHQIKIPTSVP